MQFDVYFGPDTASSLRLMHGEICMYSRSCQPLATVAVMQEHTGVVLVVQVSLMSATNVCTQLKFHKFWNEDSVLHRYIRTYVLLAHLQYVRMRGVEVLVWL